MQCTYFLLLRLHQHGYLKQPIRWQITDTDIVHTARNSPNVIEDKKRFFLVRSASSNTSPHSQMLKLRYSSLANTNYSLIDKPLFLIFQLIFVLPVSV